MLLPKPKQTWYKQPAKLPFSGCGWISDGLNSIIADRSRLGGMGFRYYPTQDGRTEYQPPHTTQPNP